MKLSTEDIDRLARTLEADAGQMIRHNINMIVQDLERANAERREGDLCASIPVKITAELTARGERKMAIECAIEWTKKVTRKDEAEGQYIDFDQGELDLQIEVKRM
jgi:hypothetical protein